MQATILTNELIKCKVVEHTGCNALNVTRDRFKFVAMVFNMSSRRFFVLRFALDKAQPLLGHTNRTWPKAYRGSPI